MYNADKKMKRKIDNDFVELKEIDGIKKDDRFKYLKPHKYGNGKITIFNIKQWDYNKPNDPTICFKWDLLDGFSILNLSQFKRVFMKLESNQ